MIIGQSSGRFRDPSASSLLEKKLEELDGLMSTASETGASDDAGYLERRV